MSLGFHPKTVGQTEWMNVSIGLYLQAFVNHQQDDWVKWLPMDQFHANNGALETMQCTCIFAIQGTETRMTVMHNPKPGPDHWLLDADLVAVTQQRIENHFWVEMR